MRDLGGDFVRGVTSIGIVAAGGCGGCAAPATPTTPDAAPILNLGPATPDATPAVFPANGATVTLPVVAQTRQGDFANAVVFRDRRSRQRLRSYAHGLDPKSIAANFQRQGANLVEQPVSIGRQFVMRHRCAPQLKSNG